MENNNDIVKAATVYITEQIPDYKYVQLRDDFKIECVNNTYTITEWNLEITQPTIEQLNTIANNFPLCTKSSLSICRENLHTRPSYEGNLCYCLCNQSLLLFIGGRWVSI